MNLQLSRRSLGLKGKETIHLFASKILFSPPPLKSKTFVVFLINDASTFILLLGKVQWCHELVLIWFPFNSPFQLKKLSRKVVYVVDHLTCQWN